MYITVAKLRILNMNIIYILISHSTDGDVYRPVRCFPLSLARIGVFWRGFKRLRTPYFQPSVARFDSGKSE